ncbi:DegT/DnrJ/EryC1/StrS aminotransferase family protein [Candidatus Woesearchaeota archaeon]|nr:DegT/DnrJ/EryC1/StrS aminotransferase family protein [Candidatus Woesearchaeota archaeon]
MLLSQQRLSTTALDLVRSLFFKNQKEREEVVLTKYISHPHRYWVGSGREALRQILLNSGVKTIGVPAFTCHVVLDAVKRAGCLPRFYDSGIVADGKEVCKIIGKVDALLVCYNFGFMPDMKKISQLCQKNKVILIEDCAQALGANCNNKQAGSFGDYAFYSFGISKNISFCGGLIASKKELNLEKLPKFPTLKSCKAVLEVLIAPFFFNKLIYPISSKLLKNELNKEQETLGYFLPRLAQKVILNQMQCYDKILQLRRNNEELLHKALSSQNVFTTTPETKSSGLYLILLNQNRDKIRTELLKRGIEFGVMNTFRCFDDNCLLAKKAEQEHLTFALYRSSKEINFVKEVLLDVLQSNKNE